MGHGKHPDSTCTTPLSTEAAEQLRQRRARSRSAYLLIYHRDNVEVVALPAGAAFVIGREPPADIVIPDKSLSRRHARVTLVSVEEACVEDLGSKNGTRAGGRRIEPGTTVLIRPGQEAMLGTVVVTLHLGTGGEAPAMGLEGHEAFRAAVCAEVERARFFGRGFAMLMVRAATPGDAPLHRFLPRLRKLLRPVDRAALYAPDTVEILLPEVGPEQALAVSRAVVETRAGEPPLVCGVASFPGAAASPEELFEVVRDQVRLTTARTTLQIAPHEGMRALASGRRPAAPAVFTAPNAAGTQGLAAAAGEGEPSAIVCQSPAMRSVMQTVTRLARSSIPLLMHGETGTGKEVLSRMIHDTGPRRDKPMICLNCGAIPAQLVESTLFGHERGAFTSADQQRKGIFEAAQGGTVLLDEIGELPAPAQAALLRVLETKRLTRVGSTKEIEVDVRVIAATHRDLEAMCDAGTFRLDLLYRLNTVEVRIPPLRARREDIMPLALRFLKQACEANSATATAIDPEALALLEKHSWPGNVRELRNVIERAVAIAEGNTILVQDLPEKLRAAKPAGPTAPAVATPAQHMSGAAGASPSGSLKDRMEQFEVETLLQALRDADWNVADAAQRLELPLRTMQHKMKTHGIKRLGFGVGDPESTA